MSTQYVPALELKEVKNRGPQDRQPVRGQVAASYCLSQNPTFSQLKGVLWLSSRPVIARRGSQGEGLSACNIVFSLEKLTESTPRGNLEQKTGCGPPNTAPAHLREGQKWSAWCAKGRVHPRGPLLHPQLCTNTCSQGQGLGAQSC